ncbi:MAG: hypothetical protein ACTHL1_04720 [Burkholderiaceae bacterium]
MAIFLALGAGAFATAHAADWYVDGRYGNNYNSGSASAPLKDFWKAWGKAQPGDTIHLLPTVTYGPQWLGNKSGLPDAPITIRGEGTGANMTKISGMGQNFGINAASGVNYINIENLDVTAPGHGNNSGWSAIYLAGSHHVNITGNYTHDSGCAGIQTYNSDYVTIKSNRVANNSKDTWNRVYCSGISNHEDLDSDGNTGVKMRIEGNIVYGNTNTPTPGCSGSGCYNSDGSGIIIDDNRRTQTDGKSYKGRTLIQNNVVFNNGGRGIAIYYSNNVDILSNTTYKNNRDPKEGAWRPGEIGITFSGNVNAYSNILYSDGLYGSTMTGVHVSLSISDNNGWGPINADYNLFFNPQWDQAQSTFGRYNKVAASFGSHNRFADPLYKQASTDGSQAQFWVRWGSPVINFGVPWDLYAHTDINGAGRGVWMLLGAYQTATN